MSRNPFNGVKVFAATMIRDREVLGEKITRWLEDARRRPGFKVVDIVVRQSSDEAFHCLTYVIFFIEEICTTKDTP